MSNRSLLIWFFCNFKLYSPLLSSISNNWKYQIHNLVIWVLSFNVFCSLRYLIPMPIKPSWRKQAGTLKCLHAYQSFKSQTWHHVILISLNLKYNHLCLIWSSDQQLIRNPMKFSVVGFNSTDPLNLNRKQYESTISRNSW